jgi:preprotein translocase subunit SecF
MDKKKNIIILVVTSIIFILLLILFIVSINKGKETINELKPNNDANIKSASKATVNNEVSNKSNDKDEDETITRQDNNDSSVDIKNENANILTINTSNQILELSKKYPSYYQSLNYIYEITERNTIFDYEVLSKAYDGIYINYENIYREIKSEVFDS